VLGTRTIVQFVHACFCAIFISALVTPHIADAAEHPPLADLSMLHSTAASPHPLQRARWIFASAIRLREPKGTALLANPK